jgi:hypothetical protein
LPPGSSTFLAAMFVADGYVISYISYLQVGRDGIGANS